MVPASHVLTRRRRRGGTPPLLPPLHVMPLRTLPIERRTKARGRLALAEERARRRRHLRRR